MREHHFHVHTFLLYEDIVNLFESLNGTFITYRMLLGNRRKSFIRAHVFTSEYLFSKFGTKDMDFHDFALSFSNMILNDELLRPIYKYYVSEATLTTSLSIAAMETTSDQRAV